MTLMKTEKGQQALKDRSVPLTARQRSAFILCDGKRSLAEVLAATSGLGVTPEDIQHLVGLGLLSEPTPASAALATAPSMGVPQVPGATPGVVAPGVAAPGPASSLTADQERYQRAYPIATRLTAALGLRGFRLNLAVEGVGNYQELLELAPKIREAVGEERFRPLGEALSD